MSRQTSTYRFASAQAASFLALDFETADDRPDSACAVGLVRVDRLRIVESVAMLIKPPRDRFTFTHLHSIDRSAVMESPSFGNLWPTIASYFENVVFIAAHNADFDRNVLQTCCRLAHVTPPKTPFLCTVQLARTLWRLKPARLPDVCRHLGIELHHHDPASDAEACARIVIAAFRRESN